MKLNRLTRATRPMCAGAMTALVAALACAGSASAQPEQWLEYHTATEPQGYNWLQLTTNAPSGVALPKLQSVAYFGEWKNGVETNKGRVFCLDRAAKSGPYDRLIFDANGNGRLDDDPVVACSRREEYMAYFEPAKLVFKCEDGPISYHLIARFYRYDMQQAQLLIASGGWYEGSVELAGKKRRLRLVDSTVNGVFNDASTSPSESDRIVLLGDKGVDRYLGKYLEVDGQLLQIEVARDGAFVKVKKAEGVQFGKVRLPEAVSEFIAFGKNGHFVRTPEKGEFTLPVGEYRVNSWALSRKDDKGATWKLTGRGFTKSADFQVSADSVVGLPVGEPVAAVVHATESKGEVRFDFKLLGPLGETVDILRGNERPRAPRIYVASADGKYRSTNTFEYG